MVVKPLAAVGSFSVQFRFYSEVGNSGAIYEFMLGGSFCGK